MVTATQQKDEDLLILDDNIDTGFELNFDEPETIARENTGGIISFDEPENTDISLDTDKTDELNLFEDTNKEDLDLGVVDEITESDTITESETDNTFMDTVLTEENKNEDMFTDLGVDADESANDSVFESDTQASHFTMDQILSNAKMELEERAKFVSLDIGKNKEDLQKAQEEVARLEEVISEDEKELKNINSNVAKLENMRSDSPDSLRKTTSAKAHNAKRQKAA